MNTLLEMLFWYFTICKADKLRVADLVEFLQAEGVTTGLSKLKKAQLIELAKTHCNIWIIHVHPVVNLN